MPAHGACRIEASECRPAHYGVVDERFQRKPAEEKPSDTSLTWCYVSSIILAVNAILVSLIAVVGTLLGSLSTYLFQRRTALHAEAAARQERQRQERLVACAEFAAAVTEVKRAVITAWFRRTVKDDAWRAAMTEADRMGASAESAQIRMLLLIDDEIVRRRADELSAYISVVRASEDKTELEAREIEFAARRMAFIAAARQLISGVAVADQPSQL